MDDPFFNELFNTDYFHSFLDNRILKHDAVYKNALNDEEITSIFKKCFLRSQSISDFKYCCFLEQ